MSRALTIVCAALFACAAVLIASRTFNSIASHFSSSACVFA